MQALANVRYGAVQLRESLTKHAALRYDEG
ncbi:MAG: hypothetical protein JWO52_758 [Gammaproteobacteria bacterium]|jgi:hypothetical protein|nr:hypothetical protein [Gammaproteobacteria bacterium]